MITLIARNKAVASSSFPCLYTYTVRAFMNLSTKPLTPEIEELHHQAVLQGSTTYHDPSTGFNVFTEIAHLRRGKCCGNQCRHCPYGWENVSLASDKTLPNQISPKVKSGDDVAIQQLLSDIQARTMSSAVVNKEKTGGRHGGRFTDKNVPYTRGGDQGTAQLLTGERRAKDDAAFEAMGTVDELCSVVGVAHAGLNESDPHSPIQMDEWLLEIMSRLFDIGSHVAKPRKLDSEFHADGVGGGFDEHYVEQLEDWIDLLTEALPELQSFILPTGAVTAAHLHVARTVCRRAERRVIPLVVREQGALCDPHALKYLNRLSDFFFAAARWANLNEKRDEVMYRRPAKGSKQRNRCVVSLQQENTQTEVKGDS
jgi:cob(I)alamin adenosyltransferase